MTRVGSAQWNLWVRDYILKNRTDLPLKRYALWQRVPWGESSFTCLAWGLGSRQMLMATNGQNPKLLRQSTLSPRHRFYCRAQAGMQHGNADGRSCPWLDFSNGEVRFWILWSGRGICWVGISPAYVCPNFLRYMWTWYSDIYGHSYYTNLVFVTVPANAEFQEWLYDLQKYTKCASFLMTWAYCPYPGLLLWSCGGIEPICVISSPNQTIYLCQKRLRPPDLTWLNISGFINWFSLAAQHLWWCAGETSWTTSSGVTQAEQRLARTTTQP